MLSNFVGEVCAIFCETMKIAYSEMEIVSSYYHCEIEHQSFLFLESKDMREE